jgi:nucleoid-associated protein YgaU
MKRHFPFALILFGVISTFAALPSVPGTNEVVRYELNDGKIFSRERGDALLSALDGGRQIQELQPDNRVGVGAVFQVGTNIICALPVPPRYSLNLTLTNGTAYRLGIGDGFVELPEGRYEVKDAAQKQIAKVNDAFDADARQEKEKLSKQLVSAPKPLVYTVGTVNDGGTLSGIARFFYGDATKWEMIYEANQQLIKNPNVITEGMKLTIPKL